MYVRNNEQTNRLLIVHCHEEEVRWRPGKRSRRLRLLPHPWRGWGRTAFRKALPRTFRFWTISTPSSPSTSSPSTYAAAAARGPHTRARLPLTRAAPCGSSQAPFGPGAVQYVSEEFHIPQNMMFITCPDDHFPHRIAALGGVRVITHA